MASYDYRIISTAPGTTIETIHHAPVRTPWTHRTATDWAHMVGRDLPPGTLIEIDRRRGGNMYQTHRRYLVNEAGITKRIGR